MEQLCRCPEARYKRFCLNSQSSQCLARCLLHLGLAGRLKTSKTSPATPDSALEWHFNSGSFSLKAECGACWLTSCGFAACSVDPTSGSWPFNRFVFSECRGTQGFEGAQGRSLTPANTLQGLGAGVQVAMLCSGDSAGDPLGGYLGISRGLLCLSGLALGQSVQGAEESVSFLHVFGGSVGVHTAGSGTTFPKLQWQVSGTKGRRAANKAHMIKMIKDARDLDKQVVIS